MSGILVFHDLLSALRAGYQVEEHTSYGYLVRQRTSAGWVRALVELKP